MHSTPAQDTCALCRAKGVSLRPYGPNGTNICYECGKHVPTLVAHSIARRFDEVRTLSLSPPSKAAPYS